jgi:hypothetical protein
MRPEAEKILLASRSRGGALRLPKVGERKWCKVLVENGLMEEGVTDRGPGFRITLTGGRYCRILDKHRKRL